MNWKKIPSLSALRAFEAASRSQSFKKAAAELNVTQAAVAQHVRKLEQELSVSLFAKLGRGIQSTETGLALAQSLNSSFLQIERAIDDIRLRNERRPLRVATTPAFAANWLMPRIGEFWAKHPDVRLNIEPGIELVDFAKERIDFAIRYGTGNWPDLNSEMITDGNFWVVTKPEIVADRNVKCLSDITDLTWIFDAQMLERKSLVEREGIEFNDIAIQLLNTNTLVLAAVRSGLGVSIQPKSLVEQEVLNGALQKVCSLKQENTGYHLVWRVSELDTKSKLFRQWIRGQSETSDKGEPDDH